VSSRYGYRIIPNITLIYHHFLSQKFQNKPHAGNKIFSAITNYVVKAKVLIRVRTCSRTFKTKSCTVEV